MCMQPAALVLPAMQRMIVQSLSLIISLRMSQALAVSLAVNDMSLIPSIISAASNDFMSICLTGPFRKSLLSILSSKLVAQQLVNELGRQEIGGFVSWVGAQFNDITTHDLFIREDAFEKTQDRIPR